jgi:uncharacterized membrane protein SpoIIM required for sporulation
MALEELLDAKKAEKKPWLLFFYTLICATLAIFLSYYIFPEYSSVVLVTFSIIPIIPVLVKIFEIEEIKLEHFNPFQKRNYKEHHHKKSSFSIMHLFSKHITLLKVYFYIFFGFVIAFSFWYTFLPDDASHRIFAHQIDTLYEFNAANAIYSKHLLTNDYCDTNVLNKMQDTITDCRVVDLNKDRYHEYVIFENSSKPTKVYYVKTGEFSSYEEYVRNNVFFNNLKIMIFILLTSFVLGAGAIFTIAWNASIIGVFVGEFVNRIILFIGVLPFIKVPAYFVALPLSLFSIALHGSLEFLAYFFAAISGGMIGIAMIRHKFKDKQFYIILFESLILFLVALLLIYFGAFIESLI